jgi:hypothetical protein
MSAPTPTETLFAHGHLSTVTVNSTVCYLTEFDWDYDADEHEVTSSPSNGKKQYQLGNQGVSFNGTGYLNLTAAGGTPIALMETGSYVAIVWKPDGSTTLFQSSLAIISKINYKAPQNNQITFTFSGKAGNDFLGS